MKVVHMLCKILAYISAVGLGLMMLLTVADVFFRFFFNSPITGTTEVTELMMICVVFPGLALCALTGGHIKVDLLVARFPKFVRAIFDVITLTLSLVIFLIVAWQSMLESAQVDSTSSLISVPLAPFYWVMTGGLFIFCLATFVVLIERMKGVEK